MFLIILIIIAKILVASHIILPFLLGFKLKVVTLLPIIFGILALIAKKALFLSKISLIITSALGLGSLLLGPNSGSNIHGPVAGHYIPQPYAPPYHLNHINRFPDHQYDDSSYRANRVGKSADDAINDQIKLPENLQEVFATGVGTNDRDSRRNFAWSEEEKLKKSV